MGEAGLPAGVINFIPGSVVKLVTHVLASPDLAGIHFTGSTSVFQGDVEKIEIIFIKQNTIPA